MDYELKAEKNSKRNEKFLNEFAGWMEDKNLSERTIKTHLNNASLYLNNYLNYYDIIKMEDGMDHVYSFLDDWFIRKCLWSSKYYIKETASSNKKFYQCMSELGKVSADDYKQMCRIIKDSMDDFYASFDEYMNDDEDYYW